MVREASRGGVRTSAAVGRRVTVVDGAERVGKRVQLCCKRDAGGVRNGKEDVSSRESRRPARRGRGEGSSERHKGLGRVLR